MEKITISLASIRSGNLVWFWCLNTMLVEVLELCVMYNEELKDEWIIFQIGLIKLKFNFQKLFSLRNDWVYSYTRCFKVELTDFSWWLSNTYRVYVCMFVYLLSRRSWSTLKKFFSRFRISFSSECSSKTKIGRDLVIIDQRSK